MIIVRIDTPEDEVDFQKYLFEKGWGWTKRKFKNIENNFIIGQKLFYFLYINEEGFYFSNVITSDDYLRSISITEAKVKLFMPSIIEVDDE